jgi:F-type H+-transporting ATPase subunit b
MKLYVTVPALLAAVPAIVLAADPAAGPVSPIPGWREGLPAMITALLVFGVVVAILGKVAFPKILKGLDAREAKIREEINSAEQARKQAKEALAMYERNLAEARAEAQKMLEKTRAQQQALADELRAKADAELVVMKDRARRDIEAAKRAAIAEIYIEAANQATEIAAKILQREMTPRDQQRLIDDSLRELSTLKN